MFTLARLRRLDRPTPGLWARWTAVAAVAVGLLAGAEAGLRRYDPALGAAESFGTAARRALTPETRVLIVGTSHVFTGVRADRLGVPAANLASAGLDYRLAVPLLAAGMRQAPNAELVLFEVDGYPLHADLAARDRVPTRDLLDYGVPPAELAAVAGGPSAAETADGFPWPAVLTRPAWTPSRVLETLLTGRSRVPGPGFLGWTASFSNLKPGGRARYHDRVAVGDPAENIPSLAAMVDAATAAGLDVALFRTPHHAGYRDAAPERFGPAVGAAVAAVRDRRADTPFWDDYANPDFAAPDFFDGDHLNVRGADRYSRLLGDRVRERLRAGGR